MRTCGNQVISVFRSGHRSPSLPNHSSPSRAFVAKMSSYEHRTSCFKNFAKFKGSNIFLDKDVSPATQSIRNAKMGELQAARQRGLIAYFSGTKLVTRTKKSTKQLSHENAAFIGTADGTAARDDTLEHGNTVQVEADLTGSAEEETEARVESVQANATNPARGVTTAVSQASLIPIPAKQLSAAAPVKKKFQHA